jgi:hypothetical protein
VDAEIEEIDDETPQNSDSETETNEDPPETAGAPANAPEESLSDYASSEDSEDEGEAEAGSHGQLLPWLGYKGHRRPDGVLYEGLDRQKADEVPQDKKKITIQFIEAFCTPAGYVTRKRDSKIAQYKEMQAAVTDAGYRSKVWLLPFTVEGFLTEEAASTMKKLGVYGEAFKAMKVEIERTLRRYSFRMVWKRRELETQAAFRKLSGYYWVKKRGRQK